MIYIKTLTYLASQEVYYHCYKIFEHFFYSTFYYCLCNRYQGCERGPFPFGGKDYGCVCRTHYHYSLEQLEDIKHNSFKLEKLSLNILRDLEKSLSIDPTACFWNDEVFHKYKNYQEGIESQACLKDLINILFTISTDRGLIVNLCKS